METAARDPCASESWQSDEHSLHSNRVHCTAKEAMAKGPQKEGGEMSRSITCTTFTRATPLPRQTAGCLCLIIGTCRAREEESRPL